jgi:hypothetical protein
VDPILWNVVKDVEPTSIFPLARLRVKPRHPVVMWSTVPHAVPKGHWNKRKKKASVEARNGKR